MGKNETKNKHLSMIPRENHCSIWVYFLLALFYEIGIILSITFIYEALFTNITMGSFSHIMKES